MMNVTLLGAITRATLEVRKRKGDFESVKESVYNIVASCFNACFSGLFRKNS